MRRNRIDLDLLIILDAIYTEGGITRASKRLNLTQPAISHALGRLRELFGDPLFVREGRAVTPTPLTRNLIGPLRRALRGLETVLNDAERFDPAVATNRFAIAVRDVLEASLLPGFMERIARIAPAIEISTVHVNRRDIEAELAAGTVDVAFDLLLPFTGAIQRRRVALDQVVVLVREGHPILSRPLDLEAYLAQDHVRVSARRRGLGLEDMALRRHGRERRIRLRCQHYFTACRVLAQTDLVLSMTSEYAKILSQEFGHRILPFPIESPPIDLYLYWHANVENDTANRWLREQLLLSFPTQQVAGAQGGD
jgi:DNA-binding transcriptional LysR family regulator